MTDNKLTVGDVVTYVEWLTFMPNWTFVARPNYYASDRVCAVQVMVSAPNTSDAPLYETPLPYTFDRTVLVNLDECKNLDDVGHMILTACVDFLTDREYVEHESREFFRVNVTRDPTATGTEAWEAPFHPHRLSGRRRWDNRRAISYYVDPMGTLSRPTQQPF